MRSIIGSTSTSTVMGAAARRDRPVRQRGTGRIAAAAVTALLASTLVPGAMAPASAAVVSAPLAANGFPASFDDGNVKLGLGPVADGEGFYFNATATGGKLEVYEAALEATYTTAPAETAGQEIVFSRLRFRMTGLDAGQTYTITHPYGVDTFVAEAGARSINTTVDVGCASGSPTSLRARPTPSPTRMASTPSSPRRSRATTGASTRPLTSGATPRRATSTLPARPSWATTQPLPTF